MDNGGPCCACRSAAEAKCAELAAENHNHRIAIETQAVESMTDDWRRRCLAAESSLATERAACAEAERLAVWAAGQTFLPIAGKTGFACCRTGEWVNFEHDGTDADLLRALKQAAGMGEQR